MLKLLLVAAFVANSILIVSSTARQCGPNEVTDSCANGGCFVARTCEDLDTNNGSLVCFDVSECIPGCICKPGYVKNSRGVCIPESKCPNTKCKNPNETFLQCVSDCQVETCNQLGYGTICSIEDDPTCKAKCICIDGYVRNDNGVCIPKNDCPTCGGDPNAVSGCGINCGRQCSNYNKGPVSCITLCKDNACDCKKGYVFDDNLKICVKPQECTPICGDDEVFDGCANGGCYTSRTCKDLERNGSSICVDVDKCIPGCLCKEGLLRNKKGICIPENTCPNSKCKKSNETYVQCPAGLCSPRSCAELGFPVPCPIVGPDGQCSGGPGCICRSGFLKNKNGVCVPQNECPSCGGDKNAQSGCGNYCGKRCSDIGKKPVPCPFFCIRNGCSCKEGYYYDDIIKKCVLPGDCTIPVCGKNEVLDSCANGGCYSGRTCDDLDTLNGSTICVDPIRCDLGCLCKPGFLRNKRGVCVPEYKCPNSKCKKPNETFRQCVSNCDVKACYQLGFGPICPPTSKLAPCQAKCTCIDGYLRDRNGNCIPQDQCPSCGGDPNAQSGCGKNCGRLCSNYNTGPVVCTKECRVNSCDCKKGFVYDTNIKKCVLPRKCTPVCGQNEEYLTCAGNCFGPKNCSNLDAKDVCVTFNPQYCKGGCECKKGYVKNNNGVCILKKECPVNEQCKGPNEFYDYCPPNCAQETSSSLKKPVKCPPQAQVCRPRCRCAKGYYRNAKNICIPKEQCHYNQTVCKANEEYDLCPAACPRRLCGFNDRGVFCPKQPVPGDKNCPKPACKCKSGFYKNSDGDCVTWNECTKCKKPNEIFSQCVSNCEVQTCDQLGYGPICTPTSKPAPCQAKCTCIDGYLRDRIGNCIPKDQCPTCGGDPNAQSGCNKNCGRLCSNYNTGPVFCTKECPVNSCDCRYGFVYDTNIKKCVLPRECTPVCGQNEQYSTCAGNCFDAKNCSNVDAKDVCITINPKYCKGGCECIKGYVKNNNGVCILKKECPDNEQCKGPNEYYDYCPPNCAQETCSSLLNPVECLPHAQVCRPRCRCAEGFYRNTNNICIPKKDCPKCTKPNQVYRPCPATCPPRMCGVDDDAVRCAAPLKLGDPNCQPGCVCADGFVSDNDGNCINREQCPKCTNLHEEYVECPNPCDPNTCESIKKKFHCPLQPVDGKRKCVGQCRCKSGFVRNKLGDCISRENCLKCRGPNEFFSCGGACDNVCATLSKQNQYDCPIINIVCNKMCYCDTNYARNASGICVPFKDCPTPKCGDNEEYSPCVQGVCRPQKCSQKRGPIACASIIGAGCIKGCVCKEHFLRGDDGKCIAEDKCITPGGNPEDIEEGLQQLTEGINDFTFNCLRQMIAAKPGENIIASPLSIQIAFAQLGLGAADDSESLEQLLAALNLSSKEQISQIFKPFLKNLKGGDGVTFATVVKEFINKEFQLNPTYEQTTTDVFNATVESIDCSNPEQAANQINTYVADNTNNRIKNLVPADLINQLVRVILVNAVYFQGSWKKEFNKNDTQDRDFHIDSATTVQVPTMYIENKLNYVDSADIEAQVADIEFNNTNFKLRLVVPHKVDGLSTTLAKMTAATMKQVSDSMSVQKCKLWMPKYEINSSFEMTDILTALNVTAIFNPAKAKLVDIVNTNEDLSVSAFLHKGFIKADEEGAEAAAATGVIIGVTSVQFPPAIPEIRCDHPFPFFIYFNDQPVFAGLYRTNK